MVQDKSQQLANLAERLSEALMTAALCADEIRAIAQAEIDGRANVGRRSTWDTNHRPVPRERPLVESSTFTVHWAGKTCPLRRTILFRLAERFSRQPNQYIAADQLLRDVWDGGIKSPETIRSAVRHLRVRLCNAGMEDLARAIQGTGGCYGLILDGRL